MNILLTFDNNYAQHACVTITSLCINNKESHDFYVITDCINKENKNRLRSITNKYNSHIHFYNIDIDIIKEFPIGKSTANNYISLAAYYRLFILEILPCSISRILYLDCDIVVNNSIKSLWNHQFSQGHCILALEENERLTSEATKRLNYPSSYSYFNSGVMLIDMTMMRKIYNTKKALNFIDDYNIKYHDQDVLNGLLYDKKEFLDLRYNVLDCFLIKKATLPKRYKNQEETLKNPVIIHFSGPIKPWYIECKNPYTFKYYEYLYQTPWKDYIPQRKYNNLKYRSIFLLKRTLKWILESLHIKYYSFKSL